MEVADIMAELKALGNPQTVKTYRRHGADGDLYGVKVGDLKKIVRRIKGQQELAMELWDTGNSDAMYLAALVADGSQMTRSKLDHWAKTAWWYMLGEYSVPFVAAEHPQALAIAAKWLKSRNASVAATGWCTYALAMGALPDEALDFQQIRELLARVEEKIDSAPNRVRYCMNNFVIAVGAHVAPLLREAKTVAKRLGKVTVDMGDTNCKVPIASDTIAKIESMDRVGKKRKSTKC